MKSRNYSLAHFFVAALLQLWCLVSFVQCQNGTTSTTTTTITPSPTPTPPSTTTPSLSPGAIAGIAVGGSLVLLALVFFVVCLCCCCVRRARRNSTFTPSDKMGATQLSDTLTYQASSIQETNGIHKPNEIKAVEDEFEMQVNLAGNSLMTSGVSYTQESVETDLPLIRKSPVSLPVSAPNPYTLTPCDKGYIKMSSAGSVRSGSADDQDEADGIYSNPDSNTVSSGFAKSPTPPAAPPKLEKDVDRENLKLSETEETQEDLYVETDVFVEDRHFQDSDSYYNKDTIESIRQGRSLADVVDPVQTHALYANITGPPTPEHTLKPTDEKEDYENVEEFLGTSNSASPQRPSSTEYYNYKPPPPGSDNADEDDYNYVEVTKPDVENPYSLENDEYVYMKSHSGSSPAHAGTTPSHKAELNKYQNLEHSGAESSAGGPKKHKYSNLAYQDEESGPIVRATTNPKNSGREIMAELHFPPKAGSVDAAARTASKENLYMNLSEEAGQEELYEEL